MTEAAFRDGLMNVFTGLGVAGVDRRLSTTYAAPVENLAANAAAYRSSWLARAAVDMPVSDAFADGRSWQGLSEEITALEAEERRLGFRRKLMEAVSRGRLYGGGALFVDDEGEPAEELNPETIRQGGIRAITVLDRSELSEGDMDSDIRSPGYGRPAFWTVTSAGDGLKVHPSRLTFFTGAQTLETASVGQGGVWTDSVLACRLETIRDAEAIFANIATLTNEANVDVIRIPGLTERMGDLAGETAVRNRLSLVRMGKSLFRMLVQDAEEQYERKAVSFGALPELLDKAYQLASGAVGIPATRLLGRAPAGLNSTGDGDERVYFDRLDTMRGEAMERLSTLDECIIRSALGTRPPELHYVWPALRVVSDSERADIFDKTASAMEKVSRLGILTPKEMRAAFTNSLIEGSLVPGLEGAMAETPDADLGFGEGDDEEGEGAEE